MHAASATRAAERTARRSTASAPSVSISVTRARSSSAIDGAVSAARSLPAPAGAASSAAPRRVIASAFAYVTAPDIATVRHGPTTPSMCTLVTTTWPGRPQHEAAEPRIPKQAPGARRRARARALSGQVMAGWGGGRGRAPRQARSRSSWPRSGRRRACRRGARRQGPARRTRTR
jgi:hypothetical protein